MKEPKSGRGIETATAAGESPPVSGGFRYGFPFLRSGEIDTESLRMLPKMERSLVLGLERAEKDIPEVTDMLEEGKEDILAVYDLPKKYWKRFRTTNMLERLNEEIRRREKVVRIFPDDGSVMRLIGSLLIERDEEWSSGRVYLDMQEYQEAVLFLEKGPQDECQGSQKNVKELRAV
jgi:hypothetical protein